MIPLVFALQAATPPVVPDWRHAYGAWRICLTREIDETYRLGLRANEIVDRARNTCDPAWRRVIAAAARDEGVAAATNRLERFFYMPELSAWEVRIEGRLQEDNATHVGKQ